MKNANEPAFPAGIDQDGYNPGQNPASWGLTKREMFAMTAMQGLAANSDFSMNLKKIPKAALMMADELLAELDK